MVNVTVDFGGIHAFVADGTSGINLGIADGFATAGAKRRHRQGQYRWLDEGAEAGDGAADD